MKVITVAEAEGRLAEIIYAVTQGESIVLRDGDQEVCLSLPEPTGIDLDEDGPEMEAELLKAAKGPFTPYSHSDLRQYTEELIQKHITP
jgi:hypothetical protein